MRTIERILVVAFVAAAGTGYAQKPRWFKGNTHTHTTMSDGNATPESRAQDSALSIIRICLLHPEPGLAGEAAASEGSGEA